MNANALIAENSDGEQLTQLIQYYTGDCTTENAARDAVIAAQEVTVPVIQEFVPLLFQVNAARRGELNDQLKGATGGRQQRGGPFLIHVCVLV